VLIFVAGLACLIVVSFQSFMSTVCQPADSDPWISRGAQQPAQGLIPSYSLLSFNFLAEVPLNPMPRVPVPGPKEQGS